MSFILDALRKVEKRKGSSGEIRVAESVMGVKGRRPRGEVVALVGIAILSAGLTAAIMRYLAPDGAMDSAAPVPQVAPEEPEVIILPAPTRGRASAPEADSSPGPSSSPTTTVARPSTPVLEETLDEPEGVVTDEPPTPALETSELVLQGTSVLNGEPVAVISDKRVFVGDRVNGALVISIDAGVVVLEVEGRRIELTL